VCGMGVRECGSGVYVVGIRERGVCVGVLRCVGRASNSGVGVEVCVLRCVCVRVREKSV